MAKRSDMMKIIDTILELNPHLSAGEAARIYNILKGNADGDRRN